MSEPEPDIFAGMVAELHNQKVQKPLAIVKRLKVGDRVLLKQGWILNRPDLDSSPTTGIVLSIMVDMNPQPLSECGAGNEVGEFNIQIGQQPQPWWTNRHYIERILD